MSRARKAIATAAVAALAAIAAPTVDRAEAFHGHVYNCAGVAGKNTVCLDPTTGYGPVLYIFLGTQFHWATGVSGVCLAGGANSQMDSSSANRARWAENSSYSIYGPGSSDIAVSNGSLVDCDGPNVYASAWMPQSTYDQFWFASNANGVYYAHVVH